jgi:NAD(P)H-nitrite reductase large subunit
MNSVEFFDLPMVSMGIYRHNENHEVLFKVRPTEDVYKKLVMEDRYLVGAILVGDINHSGVFLRLIRDRVDINSIKDKLLNDNFGYPDIIELMKERDKVYV